MKVGVITPDGKQDYLVELVIEGLRKRGDIIFATDLSNGVDRSEVLDDNKFIQKSSEFDALIVFFGKVRGNRSPKYHLLDSLKDFPRDQIAYVDGSEWTCTGWDGTSQARDSLLDPSKRRGEPWVNEKMFQRVGAYFKRESYSQDVARGIIPFPFGLFDRHCHEKKDKDIDLFCSFGHTKTGLRKQVIEVCQKLQKERPDKRIVVGAGFDRPTFADMMSRSLIVVDAWGGGDCCDRFWEAAGSSACCLYQRYNIEISNPFTDWVNAVSYSDPKEFEKSANLLLDHPDAAANIGLRGNSWARLHHTGMQRATDIIQRIAK